MSVEVLILSSLFDFSTDMVALRLEEQGVGFLRLNREQLPDHRITLDPSGPFLDVIGPAGEFRVGEGLRSVWFRQPVFLRNTPSEPLSVAEQLQRSQWTAFMRGLSVFQQAAWMNHPAATYLAESKPYQLAIAQACGFLVPKTLATNDAERIRREFPDAFVAKSLDTVLLREDDDCLFTYTIINPGDDMTDAAVSPAPLFAQRALEGKVDIRVTVVGDEVFGVWVLSGGGGIEGDWRVIPKTELEYVDFEISSSLANCCHELMKRLGLSFGAIDLIETMDGIFFIEVNPTGEWGWLAGPERLIDVSIANWLTGKSRVSAQEST